MPINQELDRVAYSVQRYFPQLANIRKSHDNTPKPLDPDHLELASQLLALAALVKQINTRVDQLHDDCPIPP